MFADFIRKDVRSGCPRRRRRSGSGGRRRPASIVALLHWQQTQAIERVEMGGKSSKPLRDAGRAVLARRQVPVESPSVHMPPQSTPSMQHVDMPHAHHEPAPAREEPVRIVHEPSKHIPLQTEPPSASSSSQSSSSSSQSSTVEPPVFPEQRPPSSDDFSNPSGAPLPPDLLAAISKWQVRKNVAPQVR